MVSLRPLTRADFPMLARWLAEPLVARWWHQGWSDEDLERDFGRSLDGDDPCVVLVASTAEGAVGLVQHYSFDDEPGYVAELAPLLVVPAGAVSIDYLLGEPWARGRGLGADVIDAAVAHAWAADPGGG